MKKLIGHLLWLANAVLYRNELEKFYPIKRRILERFGTFDGYDWQEIAKICFACDGTGEDYHWAYWDDDDKKVECERCGGDGYYQHFWTKLERRKLSGKVFHTPIDKIYDKPQGLVTINGYIKHPPVSHKKALRAFMILQILFSPRDFFIREEKFDPETVDLVVVSPSSERNLVVDNDLPF